MNTLRLQHAFLSNIDTLSDRVKRLRDRLDSLELMELKGQTNYSGEDLNTLERVSERLCSDTLSEEDLLEIEKLMFKFM